MKDPKVEEAVNELVDLIAETNALLQELFDKDVNPRLEITSDEKYMKQIRCRHIQQNVNYYEEEEA